MTSEMAGLPSDTLPSDLGEKQLLLDCLLQDPETCGMEKFETGWRKYRGRDLKNETGAG